MTQQINPFVRKWAIPWSEFLHLHAFVLFLVLLILWLTPTLILQQDACFIQHDNLEISGPTIVATTNSGAYFHTNGSIPQIMNGMPRACLPNALNITNLLFYFLPPFTAYLINFLLVHLIAFLGMFLLLRSYCPSNRPLINASISFAFAVLPFYTMFSLSIAGQPFVSLSLSCRCVLSPSRPLSCVHSFL